MQTGAEIFHALKLLLSEAGLSTAVGDEGGFAPAIGSTTEAMDFILKAIEKSGRRPGEDVTIALDAAATEFCADGTYQLAGEGKSLSSDEMIAFWQDMAGATRLFRLKTRLMKMTGQALPR